MTTKSWVRCTAATAIAFAMTASISSFACDQHAQAADAKDPKGTAAAGDPANCDKPCCAKKAATEAKAATAPAPIATAANGAPCDGAKSADGKSCPKKATLVAKADPVKEAAKAEPAPSTGANR